MTVHVKMHVTVHVTVHAKRENDVVEQENESMRDGKGKNKKKKWIKRRHAVIMNLARPFFNAFLRVPPTASETDTMLRELVTCSISTFPLLHCRRITV